MPDTLLFAVFDGVNPRTWKPYDRPFEEVVNEVVTTQPFAVPQDLRNEFEIVLQPVLEPIDRLLEESQVAGFVGAIIDILRGSPTDAIEKAHRRLCGKIKRSNSPLYKTYGYHLWFVTADNRSPAVELAVEQLVGAAHDKLSEPNVSYDFIISDQSLDDLASSCLSNAYWSRGAKAGRQS